MTRIGKFFKDRIVDLVFWLLIRLMVGRRASKMATVDGAELKIASGVLSSARITYGPSGSPIGVTFWWVPEDPSGRMFAEKISVLRLRKHPTKYEFLFHPSYYDEDPNATRH